MILLYAFNQTETTKPVSRNAVMFFFSFANAVIVRFTKLDLIVF